MDAETFRTGIDPDGKPVIPAPLDGLTAAQHREREHDRRVVELLEANNRLVEERRERDAIIAAMAVTPKLTWLVAFGADHFIVTMNTGTGVLRAILHRAALEDLVLNAKAAIDGGRLRWPEVDGVTGETLPDPAVAR